MGRIAGFSCPQGIFPVTVKKEVQMLRDASTHERNRRDLSPAMRGKQIVKTQTYSKAQEKLRESASRRSVPIHCALA